MAADQLAQSDKLREVQVNPQDLPKLPAGAVVVWDRGNGHEHGHISICDGKGGEYSDVYRQQTTNYGTQCRVFLPADMQTNTPTSDRTSAPAPARTSAPAPARTSAPAPARTSAPAPARTSAPAPARTSTPTPSRPTTPGK
ncbi:MAG: hypothetical protein GX934_01075 [Burkholderiales bacterium]|nr:hypothetical protein [Burkholderiales bacterium]